MTYIALFFSSLVFIAMRAFQQLNVQHHRYAWVPPVTAMLAVTFGGVLGCWFSMWLHKKMRERNSQ